MNLTHRLVITLIVLSVALISALSSTALIPGGGSATPATGCDPTMYPIQDFDETYAYRCIDASHATSCKKSDPTKAPSSFEIPAGNRLRDRCSSSAASATPTSFSCQNAAICKQLDEVWTRIINFVNPKEEIRGKVWNNQWQEYDVVYGPPPSTYQEEEGEDSFDDLIRFAANQYGIEARLIKAIMLQESNGVPSAISSTGCVGLMQVCESSAPTDVIQTKCHQNNGPVLCEGKQDDRFDPRKNILAGTVILKGKWNAIGSCGADRTKAVIAAYNVGEGVVKEAIRRNSDSCNDWNNVLAQIDEQLLAAFFSDQYLTRAGISNPSQWRQNKIGEITIHVDRVSENYDRLADFQ